MYPQEFLNSLNISGLPPHELHLKVNTPVMLLRNMDPLKGHCNGTRYVIRRIISDRLIEAEIITGEHKGSTLLIPRVTMSPADCELPFTLRRRQFPLRPAFCMTINKCQGQSLKVAGIFLPEPAFTHGQLYVAASRVGDSQRIRFAIDQTEYRDLTIRKRRRNDEIYTRNVVYTEILQ